MVIPLTKQRLTSCLVAFIFVAVLTVYYSLAVALLLPGRKNIILKKTVLPLSLHKKRYP